MRMRRANWPDLEHGFRLSGVVDINCFAGDVFVRAFVRLRSDWSRREKTRDLLVRERALFLREEFAKQIRDQLLPVNRAAAHVGNGSELVLENRNDFFARRIAPPFSDE